MADETLTPIAEPVKAELTAEIVRELLDYDPETGLFRWRSRDVKWFSSGKQSAAHACARWNTQHAGKPAFVGGKRYREGNIFDRGYLAHRIAWLHYCGEWPSDHIDHIDHDRHNNRIANLRDVSGTENHRNQRMDARNTSGVTGVYWHKTSQRWVPQIFIDGKIKNLGTFARFEDAVAARKAAQMELNYHPNHGI